MKYFTPLEPNKFYHIFNHAVGNENFFKTEGNYIYFLKKFKECISPIADIYAFVLMPNHFHFLIEIKNEKEIYTRYLELKLKQEVPNEVVEKKLAYEKFVMQQFSNFFNCYTKPYNKKYNRKGALFLDYLKRSPVLDQIYLQNMVLYIHQNPIHHNYCTKLEDRNIARTIQ